MAFHHSNARFANDKDFIRVTWNGPKYAVNVPSPSGILNKKYGQQYYGMYTNGKEFYVHKNDVRARPDLFTGVNEDDLKPDPVEAVEEKKPKSKQPAPPVVDEPEGITEDKEEGDDEPDTTDEVEVRDVKPATNKRTRTK